MRCRNLSFFHTALFAQSGKTLSRITSAIVHRQRIVSYTCGFTVTNGRGCRGGTFPCRFGGDPAWAIALSQLFLPQCLTARNGFPERASPTAGLSFSPYGIYSFWRTSAPLPRASDFYGADESGRVRDPPSRMRYARGRRYQRPYTRCWAHLLGQRIDLRKIHGPFSPISRPYSSPSSLATSMYHCPARIRPPPTRIHVSQNASSDYCLGYVPFMKQFDSQSLSDR